MIRVMFLSASVLLFATAPSPGATQVSGDQSGTWTLAQSPYELVGDVRVPPGQTLTIEPGVTVIGMGYYKILVDQSTLLAVGTEDDPILFTAQDPVTGWRGIRFEYAQPDSVIDHCIVEYARGTGSHQEVAGGAIYCRSSDITISHNVLRFNSSHNEAANGLGAGVACLHSSPQITDNLVHDNSADSGAGIYCGGDGTPLIADNAIMNNTATYKGGGLHFGWEPRAIVERNVIMWNHSDGNGGGGLGLWYWFARDAVYSIVRDNLIAENTSSSRAGGVYASYDKTPLINNTIVNNSAATGGGIYALNDGVYWPELTNCILWGNTATSGGDQIALYNGTGSWITVRYSDVQGGYPGPGNMDADPLFVGGEPFDYHLRRDSPCIDVGDPAMPPAPGETDIDGEPRWAGELVDMGADEVHMIGDFDFDGDVDLDDFSSFSACYNGASNPPAGTCPPGVDADLDDDGDVDLDDFSIFAANYTGSL